VIISTCPCKRLKVAIGAELSETEFPKLSHSPLREALVDIRLREELPASVLSQFKAPKGLAIAKEIRQGQFQVKIEKDKPVSTELIREGALGWRYEREDSSVVVQLRRNGMTYSILKDYPGWNVLRAASRDEWQEFLSVSGSVNASRLAVRYVNAIDIPMGADYDEYLTTAPRVPKAVPPIVNSFMQRVLVPVEEHAANVIITQTLETPAKAAVLDIDVFAECSLDGASSEIWQRLDILRNVADRIFFSSLTQKVIESYL
jgi:uncharacterized protein (TIGR04255 family)